MANSGGFVGAVSSPLSERGKKRALRQYAPLRYGTFEVADMAGVNWRTVYRWLERGDLPEPERDEGGRRLWTPEAATAAIALGARSRRKHAKDRDSESQGRNRQDDDVSQSRSRSGATGE